MASNASHINHVNDTAVPVQRLHILGSAVSKSNTVALKVMPSVPKHNVANVTPHSALQSNHQMW